MRLCYVGKDGGVESTVWGFWPLELKSVCSIALLCFEDGSREAFHTHAFNSVSWLLSGQLCEQHYPALSTRHYLPSLRPIRTTRDTFHKVSSTGRSWVLTFRGPWSHTWREFLPRTGEAVTLTSGRRKVATI